jgi:predicted lipase
MIDAWNCSYCQMNETVTNFKTSAVYDRDGEVVYVGYNPDYDQIITVFQGSSDIQNWATNLDTTKEDYPYCKGCEVHKGFYELWKLFEDDVIQEVNTLLTAHPTASVVTSGHSLGASLATLASVDILNNLTSNAPVYTWTIGSPRVGNNEFSDWYLQNTVQHNQRIVNWHDVVPHLPSEVQGFRHVPQEVWEQKDVSDFVVCSSTDGEDSSCSDSVFFPSSVYDHTHYFGLAQGEEYC